MQPADPTNLPGNGSERKPHKAVFALSAWLRDLLFAVGISFLIITFLYQPVRVEGTSMMPELQDQERLFINKFEYHFEPIHRGDVVVFHYPRDPAKSYIKRIIAVPGDDVRIDEGQVYVNGKALSEPYVPLRFRDERSYPDTVLTANQYFVMGGPSPDFKRQPGFWPRAAQADLWQGILCLLADGRYGSCAVSCA